MNSRNGKSAPAPRARIATSTSLARELIAAWNAHDARRVADLFSDDHEGEDIGSEEPLIGPQSVRRQVLYNLAGFPDLRVDLEHVVAEKNCVVIVWTVTGTHLGRVMNIPPTGRRVHMRGMTYFEVRGDKICRTIRVWDLARMLREIGLLPELQA